jgi:hypothetical protein
MTLPDTKVKINGVFEKSLYKVKKEKNFSNELKEEIVDIDIDDFYNIFFVDEELLKSNINYFLQTQPQISLEYVIKKFPITKGIAELISYISIAKNSQNTHIDTTKHIKLTIKDSDENIKVVSVPNIIFIKDKS